MKPLFARWLPAATLAAWGGIILYYSFDGRLNAALAKEFRIYALIAAPLMLLGALVLCFAKTDQNCCADSACGHGLSRGSFGRVLSFLVLGLPIGLAPFGSKAALNNIQAQNKIASDVTPPPANIAQQPSDWLVRTPEGNIQAEVLDLLYAAQDNVLRKDFEGKRIELIGQFMPDTTNNPNGNRFKAVRMFMVCCAADSRPVATLVEMDKLPTIAEMTWVKIIGTPTFPVEKGRRISVLKAEVVTPTAPPEEATLY